MTPDPSVTAERARGDQQDREIQRRAPVQCVCSGAPDAPNLQPCPADATQEDFLCDHCRVVACPTRTSRDMDDFTLCVRLDCPEHGMPNGRPVAMF